MPRPQIRFLLQEVDLPLGATLIGRGPECHVTLDDPMVSRRHARILVGSDRTVVEDLGSRNGVFVNGTGVYGPKSLRHGDRLQIGAHRWTFCEVGLTGKALRPTGPPRLCARCGKHYASESVSCPACEASGPTDEDTPLASVEPPR